MNFEPQFDNLLVGAAVGEAVGGNVGLVVGDDVGLAVGDGVQCRQNLLQFLRHNIDLHRLSSQ